MISEHSKRVAERAQRIYANSLQDALEAEYIGKFVAIEPESGDHFIGESFSQAVAAARREYPDRISFVIRIGHAAALHLGGMLY